MKRLTVSIILAASFALTLIVSAVMSRDFSLKNNDTPPPPAPTAVTKSDEPKAAVSGYIVGVFEGKVAVFSSDGVLNEVYDVPISTLPEYDRELLEKGISVPDALTLRALIEDYTS